MFVKLLLLSFAVCVFSFGYAQNPCSVKILLPKQLQAKKVTFTFFNGKKKKQWDVTNKQSNITFSDSLFVKYGSVKISIDSNKLNVYPGTYHSFFILQGNSLIDLSHYYKREGYAFLQSSSKNAMSIDTEMVGFLSCAEKEQEKYIQYCKSPEGLDLDSVRLYNEPVLEKQLSFLKDSLKGEATEYIALELFRTFLAPNMNYEARKVEDFYNTFFSAELKKTDAGKNARDIVNGRLLASQDSAQAPPFSTKDITGQILSFGDQPGKLILLNFWSSSCGPCIAEMPAIREISAQFPKEELEVISVSVDRDSTVFIKSIKKHQMNWTNVYRDMDLIALFGGAQAIPQLFLINKKGMVVYNRERSAENDPEKLTTLKSIIAHELHQ